MKQTELDFIGKNQRIDFVLPEGAVLYLYQRFYTPTPADQLFNTLLKEVDWQEEEIVIFGKRAKVPRLMCWYGDADAYYLYSGVNHTPSPWNTTLLAIKKKIELECECSFNSVLANLYRDGNDSMGCHADDEKELGINPTIASLSLGDERLFKLHHKKRKQSLNIKLNHGDLLVMGGSLQQYWVHSVPKTKRPKTARINLTFRKIVTGFNVNQG